ncbi:MAG: queuosine precursor transporter, partial [Spirochaetales bacterium]|nr:queuosine precursor transporter [Spirochaetales bacterium]
MNELFWFVMLLCNFTLIMFAFRRWGKLGLFIWVPISVIVANIQVTKNVMLFGLEATLGNIVYATGFLATDILTEFYGKKESAKAVAIGFF